MLIAHINTSIAAMKKRTIRNRSAQLLFLALFVLVSCAKPEEEIVLRHIRDVVVDASSEPMLKANAVFFNPNDMRGKLRKIDVEIFVDGKKSRHCRSGDENLNPSAVRIHCAPGGQTCNQGVGSDGYPVRDDRGKDI